VTPYGHDAISVFTSLTPYAANAILTFVLYRELTYVGVGVVDWHLEGRDTVFGQGSAAFATLGDFPVRSYSWSREAEIHCFDYSLTTWPHTSQRIHQAIS
jgi:hypothetical protein